jgi:hypothetical protein
VYAREEVLGPFGAQARFLPAYFVPFSHRYGFCPRFPADVVIVLGCRGSLNSTRHATAADPRCEALATSPFDFFEYGSLDRDLLSTDTVKEVVWGGRVPRIRGKFPVVVPAILGHHPESGVNLLNANVVAFVCRSPKTEVLRGTGATQSRIGWGRHFDRQQVGA